MNTRNNCPAEEPVSWREPFPEPRTLPVGWDLSELIAIPWPFTPSPSTCPVELPWHLWWSDRVRAMLARVGNFVSSLSHSIATR